MVSLALLAFDATADCLHAAAFKHMTCQEKQNKMRAAPFFLTLLVAFVKVRVQILSVLSCSSEARYVTFYERHEFVNNPHGP